MYSQLLQRSSQLAHSSTSWHCLGAHVAPILKNTPSALSVHQSCRTTSFCVFYTLAHDLSDHYQGVSAIPEADPALDFPSTSASFLVMARSARARSFVNERLGECILLVAMCASIWLIKFHRRQ